MNAKEPWEVVDGRAMAVFEIYIKTTPERLWKAITDAEMRAKYTFGLSVKSSWQPGSRYEGQSPTAALIIEGENLDVDPPRRLVQSFRALWSEEVKREGTSRVTWEIEPVADSCRLTVLHAELREDANPELYGGWMMVLSGLKTVLETGELERVGSSNTRRVNVRVIAATNVDVNAEAAAGRFRQDLLFRLNTIEIHLPPLKIEDLCYPPAYVVAEGCHRTKEGR